MAISELLQSSGVTQPAPSGDSLFADFDDSFGTLFPILTLAIVEAIFHHYLRFLQVSDSRLGLVFKVIGLCNQVTEHGPHSRGGREQWGYAT